MTTGLARYDAACRALAEAVAVDEVIALRAQDKPYDAADDFSRSLDACYAAIRERVAAGGKGWPR